VADDVSEEGGATTLALIFGARLPKWPISLLDMMRRDGKRLSCINALGLARRDDVALIFRFKDDN
jgi:hypothetical protein